MLQNYYKSSICSESWCRSIFGCRLLEACLCKRRYGAEKSLLTSRWCWRGLCGGFGGVLKHRRGWCWWNTAWWMFVWKDKELDHSISISQFLQSLGLLVVELKSYIFKVLLKLWSFCFRISGISLINCPRF